MRRRTLHPEVKMTTREKLSIYAKLILEARPIWKWLALSCLLCLIIIACAVVSPQLMGEVTNTIYDYWSASVSGGEAFPLVQAIVPTLLLLFLSYAVSSVVRWLNMYLMNNVVSHHYTCAIRIRMSDKIRRLPVKFVDGTPVGQILENMTGDVSAMGNSIHQIVEILVQGVLQLIFIAAAMLLEDWRLGLIVLATAPLSFLLSVKISGASGKYHRASLQESAEIYSVVEESYTNFATTKAYNLEQAMEEKHSQANQRQQAAQAKANFVTSLVQPSVTLLGALTYLTINLVGGYLAVQGAVPIGVVVTIVLFARQFSAPMEQIANGLSQMQRVTAASIRVFNFLDQPEEDPRNGEVDPRQIQGEVVFDHVAFSYNPDQPLIRDLNFVAHPGQTIAIVGPTGAGKTTIVNLLMGFYDITAGDILIDGRPISQMSRDQARELFGMVLQETWLFRGTVAENIAYGRPDATREEIIQACDDAYCDHFIRTLPQGYDTVIGDETTTLSGGQKQLLTIARAILADRRLLILDEATSNVDTRTEILIQKAMDKLMRGRTCFVIAHRLSTIVNADRILVIRDGDIVEQGTHQQLLAKKGFYAQLYASQYDQAI
ncbi:MAG TPA: ABC transporter ATP-binding protein [Candidatus Enterenecus stercoripullorum]|nr:ABC transporter ATP-binding protein [Candidatus Enterenecus stercoripullorum]